MPFFCVAGTLLAGAGLALLTVFAGLRFATAPAAAIGRRLFNGRSLSDSKSDPSDSLPEEFQLLRLQGKG